jgi:hypothetical protein
VSKRYVSLVEDIVIVLRGGGEASGKYKARIGEGRVSCQRYCARRKYEARIKETCVSCQRYCDATTGWKPEENTRLVSKRHVSLVQNNVILNPE